MTNRKQGVNRSHVTAGDYGGKKEETLGPGPG
jgi:hypothetical protein